MNEGRITQSTGEVSLLSVLEYLLSRFYWLLLAGAVAGLLVFGVSRFLVTPIYESSVSFYVYNSPDSVTTTRTVNDQDLQAAESLATTYSKILGSNSLLDAVLSDLGSDARGLTRADLDDMVEASVVTDTQLLEVVVSSSDAQFACRVAESFENVAPSEMERITKVGGVEVVDQPEVAAEPTSPRVMFNTAVGIVVGVVVAGIVLTVRMLSDQTIYLPEDLEGLEGVIVLGSIPEVEAATDASELWKLSGGGKTS